MAASNAEAKVAALDAERASLRLEHERETAFLNRRQTKQEEETARLAAVEHDVQLREQRLAAAALAQQLEATRLVELQTTLKVLVLYRLHV